MSVTKPAQQETVEKPAVNGFAKRIPTNPVPASKLSPQEEKPFFPFPGMNTSVSCFPLKLFEREITCMFL